MENDAPAAQLCRRCPTRALRTRRPGDLLIKAVTTLDDGRKLLILGLSEMNIRELKKGRPISIELEKLGLEGQIAIVYGETEADIVDELSKHFKLPPP